METVKKKSNDEEKLADEAGFILHLVPSNRFALTFHHREVVYRFSTLHLHFRFLKELLLFTFSPPVFNILPVPLL